MELLIEEIVNESFEDKNKKTIDDYISVVKNTNDKFDKYFDSELMDKLIDNAVKVEEGVGDKIKTGVKAAVFMGLLASAYTQISGSIISMTSNAENTEQMSPENKEDVIMQGVMPENIVTKLKSNDKMLKGIADKFQLSYGDNDGINLKNAFYFVNQNQSEFDGNENYNKILETANLDRKELNKIIALFITKYSESIIGNMSYNDVDNEDEGYGE